MAEEQEIIDVTETEEYPCAAAEECCECAAEAEGRPPHKHSVKKCVEDYQRSCVIEIEGCNDVLEYELEYSELSSLGKNPRRALHPALS